MNERSNTDMLRPVFDAFPSLLFVVNDDMRIEEYNTAAAGLLAAGRTTILKRRAGEALHCLHSTEVPEGCGRAPFCKDCVIRNAVTEASQGNRVARRRAKLEFFRDGKKRDFFALVTASPFRFQERPLALLVLEDINEMVELQRMIPICSICKKVRDDRESWMRIEAYFKDHWDVDFSHGLCLDCYKTEVAKLEGDLEAGQTAQPEDEKTDR